MSRRILTHATIGVMALATAYLGSYAVLSANGNWNWSQTGNKRYASGLAVSDVERWHPAYARWERYTSVDGSARSRGNIIGYIFSPLIRLDRAFWHPDKSLFELKSLG
jgi:hypothetical protein